VSYVGHVISEAEVSMDADKVVAVSAWPQPRSAQGSSRLPGAHRVLQEVHPRLRPHRGATHPPPAPRRLRLGQGGGGRVPGA
jgi:hypothetical protein